MSIELRPRAQRRAKISALGTYVPPRILSNADLATMVDTSDEWIMQRLGIRERHLVDPGIATSDMAVEAARRLHPQLPLEVEVENLDELAQAIAASVDRIMLDNFTPALMREAVALTARRVPLEVSGNVDLDSIVEYAHTGVDFISVGALTKHVRAVDLSLRLELI